MKTFFDYYLGTIIRPRRTFEFLLADDRRLKFGLIALSINAALYTSVYIFLTISHGAPSSFKPWLAIPADVYYSYNRFMLAPSMLMAWILAAGVGQLLSRLFSGKGRFEDTLSVFGFGISIACLPSLLHDLPDSFLGAIGVLNLREYEVALNTPTIWRTILLSLYSISVGWFFVLFIKGIGVVQKIRPWVAYLTGAVSYIVYQFFFFMFNR